MKGIVLVAGLASATLAGCCHCPGATTMGWKFEMGRPATFSSPGLVQQQSGTLALQPLGTTLPPVLTGTAVEAGPVRLQGPAPTPQPRLNPRLANECTMEDICAMLRRIESRLASGGAPARPLPPGAERLPAPSTD